MVHPNHKNVTSKRLFAETTETALSALDRFIPMQTAVLRALNARLVCAFFRTSRHNRQQWVVFTFATNNGTESYTLGDEGRGLEAERSDAFGDGWSSPHGAYLF